MKIMLLLFILSLLLPVGIGLYGNESSEKQDSTETQDVAPITHPLACPTDVYNTLIIYDRKEYSATEGNVLLPEGYVFLRELSEKEAMATALAGCKIYVPVGEKIKTYWDDFWLYQPKEKLTKLPYGGGDIPLTYGSNVNTEWIYTHWEPAPQPPERTGLENKERK